jgi:ribosomal protein S18 acetylase RimI-like enzyme
VTTYRKLAEGDFGGVHRVALESWRKAYQGIYDDDFIRSTMDSSYSEERLRPFLSKVRTDGAFFEVAACGTEIVGFCVVVQTPSGPEMTRLYVLPAFFGTGVGWRLLRHAEEYIRSRGYRGYHCVVHKSNERAKRFYLRAGLRHVPDLDTVDDWYLEKSLTLRGAVENALARVWRMLRRALRSDRSPNP